MCCYSSTIPNSLLVLYLWLYSHLWMVYPHSWVCKYAFYENCIYIYIYTYYMYIFWSTRTHTVFANDTFPCFMVKSLLFQDDFHTRAVHLGKRSWLILQGQEEITIVFGARAVNRWTQPVEAILFGSVLLVGVIVPWRPVFPLGSWGGSWPNCFSQAPQLFGQRCRENP